MFKALPIFLQNFIQNVQSPVGIDVSKNKLDCSLIRKSFANKYLDKKIPNSPDGYEKLLQWCCQKSTCSPKDIHVILEATGPYHEAVAYWFYSKGCQITVVNPSRVKDFIKSEGIRSKNDKLDARMIALFGLKKELPCWEPTPIQYQELQSLLARMESINDDLQRENNRLEKMRASAFTSSGAMESIHQSIEFLQQQKQDLMEKIQHHLDQHPDLKKDQELLKSIPGIGPIVSMWMNALLQHHMRFATARQAAAYLGLTPIEHTSGKSVSKRPKLSKAGPAIYRKKLYMAAISAIKCNPDIKNLYERTR